MSPNHLTRPDYLETYSPFKGEASFSSIIDAVEAQFPESEGPPAVCDLMSGTGLVAAEIMRHFGARIGTVTCLDVQQQMLERAQELLGALSSCNEVRTIRADIRNMRPHLHRDEFALAVCRGGFNNLEEESYIDALTEIGRIVMPDGVLVVQDHFPRREDVADELNVLEQTIARIEGRRDVPYTPTEAQFYELLDDAHFFKCNENRFIVKLPLRARFVAKGFAGASLESAMSQMRDRLRKKDHLKRSYEGDEIIVSMPIVTITAVNEKPHR